MMKIWAWLVVKKIGQLCLFEYIYVSTCLIKTKFYWYYGVHENNIEF